MTSDCTRLLTLLTALSPSTQQFYFHIDGEPIAKSRVRVNHTRRYAEGRTRDAELDIARELQRGAVPRFDGNVAIAAVFFRSNRHRIDVDNLLKTVLDGVTKSGLVWGDDEQVTAVLGVVEHDPVEPRTLVAIGHHQSTMLRGAARLTSVCDTCGCAYRPHSPQQPSRYCSAACRPRRVQICSDCGGRTSAPHVRRCRACHQASLSTSPSAAAAPSSSTAAAEAPQGALL